MTFQQSTLAPDGSRDPLKADLVYEALRARIRDLDLPPGAPLRKDALALEFGVSKAPISDAIARLAEEGLVDVFAQHGSFVAPIRASDVREGLFIRFGLEIEAMREAARASDPDLISSLDKNLAAQSAALIADNMDGFFALDEAMHALIFSAVGHSRAERLLDAARAPLDRARRLALPEAGRPEATLLEHRRLVEAIRMSDPEFAAASMRAHLTAVAASVERELVNIPHIEGQVRPASTTQPPAARPRAPRKEKP